MKRFKPLQLAWACGLAITVARSSSFADGAFPDSMSVLLPADQSHQIFVATNFGLLTTQNDGQSWDYVCEEGLLGPLAWMYQLGPSPQNLLYAVSLNGISLSADNGCTWQISSSTVPNVGFVDAFPDPTAANHVLAIGRVSNPGPVPETWSLYESRDSGRTFGAAIFVAPNGHVLSGVEVARSDPNRIYLTMYLNNPTSPRPFLVRSSDGGGTWEAVDLSSSLGAVSILLAAVDPVDPQRLFLRVIDSAHGVDSLAIADNAGQSVGIRVQLPRSMTGFLRRADGTILVAHREGGFISRDGGATFSAWLTGVALRGLGERGNRLFLVGDNYTSGFALAISDDGGLTRQTLLRYSQVSGPKNCGDIPQACAGPWATLRARFDSISDAGTGPDGGPSLPNPPADPRKQCGCESTPGEIWLALTLLFGVRAKKQKR